MEKGDQSSQGLSTCLLDFVGASGHNHFMRENYLLLYVKYT